MRNFEVFLIKILQNFKKFLRLIISQFLYEKLGNLLARLSLIKIVTNIITATILFNLHICKFEKAL